jgi:hypothetical protein
MMSFEQACAYVHATSAEAYCCTAWLCGGEWLGVQHWLLHELPADGSEGPARLGMRVRRVAFGSTVGPCVQVNSVDEWRFLPAEVLETAFGANPCGLRYAACEAGAGDELPIRIAAAPTQAFVSRSAHAPRFIQKRPRQPVQAGPMLAGFPRELLPFAFVVQE